MTSTVQKIGINIGGSSTSEVKFSTLRDTFFQTDPNVAYTGSATIKASDLLRTTTLPSNGGPQTNPTVPDATENSNILTSLGNNWRVSHFQQSVKWYNIVQSGTDLNYSIDGQSWNSNLTKNVVKRMKVTGTLGSNSTSTSATFSGSAYNLRIEVSGSVLGFGGRGGGSSGAPSISGESAGNALSVSSSTGRVIIDVKGAGKIYGGGGGGEKGETGSPGSPGSCTNSFNTDTACDNAPGCPPGYTAGGNVYTGPCGTGQKQVPAPGEGWFGGHYWQSYSYGTKYYRNCTITTTPPGGAGGAGGNGGPGRGYNNQTGSTSGASGSPGGPAVSCPSGFSGPNTSSGAGGDGGTGGSGGDWGSVGSNTPNTGDGGGAGKAISGSNYSITGSTGSSNIKGATS